jgi:hypothetical protein
MSGRCKECGQPLPGPRISVVVHWDLDKEPRRLSVEGFRNILTTVKVEKQEYDVLFDGDKVWLRKK